MLVPYATRSVEARNPEIEAMFTMLPPPCLRHRGRDGLGQHERAGEIDSQNALPLVIGGLQHGLEDGHACIVDECIEPPKMRRHSRHGVGHQGGIRDITNDCPRLPRPFQRRHGALERLAVDVEKGDAPAFLEESRAVTNPMPRAAPVISATLNSSVIVVIPFNCRHISRIAELVLRRASLSALLGITKPQECHRTYCGSRWGG